VESAVNREGNIKYISEDDAMSIEAIFPGAIVILNLAASEKAESAPADKPTDRQ
jgi:hypothetical protein